MDGATIDYSLLDILFPLEKVMSKIMNRAVRVKESVGQKLKDNFSKKEVTQVEVSNVVENEEPLKSLYEIMTSVLSQKKLLSNSSRAVLWTPGLMNKSRNHFAMSFPNLGTQKEEIKKTQDSIPSNWSEMSFDTANSLMENTETVSETVEEKQEPISYFVPPMPESDIPKEETSPQELVGENVKEEMLVSEPGVLVEEKHKEPEESVVPTFDSSFVQGIKDKIANIGNMNQMPNVEPKNEIPNFFKVSAPDSFVPEPKDLSIEVEAPAISNPLFTLEKKEEPSIEVKGETSSLFEDPTQHSFAVESESFGTVLKNEPVVSEAAVKIPNESEEKIEFTRTVVMAKVFKMVNRLKALEVENAALKTKNAEANDRISDLSNKLVSYETVVRETTTNLTVALKENERLEAQVRDSDSTSQKQIEALKRDNEELRVKNTKITAEYEQRISDQEARHKKEQERKDALYEQHLSEQKRAYERNMSAVYATIAESLTMDGGQVEEGYSKAA